MSLPTKNKEKREPRAGGKMQRGKNKLFNMRVSDEYLAAMSAAADSRGVGKTALVERALAAFCPEYFANQGPEDSSGLRCAKYAPQLFDDQREEKSSDRSGGPAVPEAKRKGDDSRGSREKFSERKRR